MTTDPPAAPAAAPPDHPVVPRPRLSKGAIALAVLGTLIVGGYSAIAYAEYEPSVHRSEKIPASVRSSPGGYRSYHFWHSGYHGGK